MLDAHEIARVAQKMDQDELEKFMQGLKIKAEDARWYRVLNNPWLVRSWLLESWNSAVAGLPVVDMIPVEDRWLLYYRMMTDRGRAKLREQVMSVDPGPKPVTYDLATGEVLP